MLIYNLFIIYILDYNTIIVFNLFPTENEYAKIEFLEEDKTRAHVHFAPTIEQQKEMAEILEKEDKDKAKNGISGQFVIEYDVERDPTGGQVLVSILFCFKSQIWSAI